MLHTLNISNFEFIIRNKLGEEIWEGKLLFKGCSFYYVILNSLFLWRKGKSYTSDFYNPIPKEVSFKVHGLILRDTADVWCKWAVSNENEFKIWIFMLGKWDCFSLFYKEEP